MELADIEKDLRHRIDQSRKWLESNISGPILGLQLRTYPCKAEPLSFLDDATRKERHGVAFRIEWDRSSRDLYECVIELRINPTACLRRDGKTEYPYIEMYVVIEGVDVSKPGKGDSTTISLKPSNYGPTLQLEIQEWWRWWVDEALLRDTDPKKSDRRDAVSKIFKYKRPVSKSP